MTFAHLREAQTGFLPGLLYCAWPQIDAWKTTARGFLARRLSMWNVPVGHGPQL
ncbi:MAG TPA: hypothetical protein VES90_08685 [Candidatus Eisenbacteria bacterium]|nr:hypothetical protein [Candidatus Eisenbacteria bacterium]